MARELGVSTVITLGALLADVPHSRPVAITGITSDESLVERLGFEPPSYEGPTGIVGVLQRACADAGAAGREPVGLGAALRGRVAEPEGRAGAGAGVRGRDRAWPSTAASSRRRPRTTSARSPPRWRATPRSRPSWSGSRPPMDEDQAENPPDEGQLPSADTIASDFQRFLRQRGPEGAWTRVVVCGVPPRGHP